MTIRVLALIITLFTGGSASGDSYPLAAPKRGWLALGELSMLPLERETTANHLSAYVANHLSKGERVDRTTWAPRLLGLALLLHPENPRARQTNEAMAKGSSLPALETELDAEVLARVLYHRAQGLEKNEGTDAVLAPYLIAVAAYIAPYLEDLVFSHESRRLREGVLKWAPISGQTPAEKQSR